MSETALSKAIREALEAKGFWCTRLQSGSLPVGTGRDRRFIKLGEPGTPDLLVMHPVFGFLEVKLPGGKLTPAQRLWHEKAARLGVPIRIVRSIHEAIEATKGMVRYE
jgi:hypothetical protein